MILRWRGEVGEYKLLYSPQLSDMRGNETWPSLGIYNVDHQRNANAVQEQLIIATTAEQLLSNLMAQHTSTIPFFFKTKRVVQWSNIRIIIGSLGLMSRNIHPDSTKHIPIMGSILARNHCSISVHIISTKARSCTRERLERGALADHSTKSCKSSTKSSCIPPPHKGQVRARETEGHLQQCELQITMNLGL